jgi:hypothetical protein
MPTAFSRVSGLYFPTADDESVAEIMDTAADDNDSEDDQVRNDEPPPAVDNAVDLLAADDANETGRCTGVMSRT